MSHLFPSAKGDQLCPLGFHPQVRWPTRCKRCFRDYKEHGNKRNGEDITASTPVLMGSSQSRSRDGGSSSSLDKPVRSWTSTQNLFVSNNNSGNSSDRPPGLPQRPASWASTPDLDNILQQVKADFTVNLTLPRRRHTTTFDNLEETETTVTLKRPPLPPILKVEPKKDETKKELEKAEDQGVVIEKGDSLAERVRKMNLIRRQGSVERDSRERSVPRKEEEEPKPVLKPIKTIEPEKVERKRRVRPIPESTVEEPISKPQLTLSKTTITSTKPLVSSTLAPVKEKVKKPSISTEPAKDSTKIVRRRRVDTSSFESPSKPTATAVPKPIIAPTPKPDPIVNNSSDDVKFLISIKDSKSKLDEDLHSITTETTETTIVDHTDNHELQEEIESLKRELDTLKARCDRAEREKSDILLRRLASIDTGSNKTAASEALKLQQKVNEQKQMLEDLQDEKKFLGAKVKELESDIKIRGAKNVEEQLRQKLEQAETVGKSPSQQIVAIDTMKVILLLCLVSTSALVFAKPLDISNSGDSVADAENEPIIAADQGQSAEANQHEPSDSEPSRPSEPDQNQQPAQEENSQPQDVEPSPSAEPDREQQEKNDEAAQPPRQQPCDLSPPQADQEQASAGDSKGKEKQPPHNGAQGHTEEHEGPKKPHEERQDEDSSPEDSWEADELPPGQGGHKIVNVNINVKQ